MYLVHLSQVVHVISLFFCFFLNSITEQELSPLRSQLEELETRIKEQVQMFVMVFKIKCNDAKCF